MTPNIRNFDETSIFVERAADASNELLRVSVMRIGAAGDRFQCILIEIQIAKIRRFSEFMQWVRQGLCGITLRNTKLAVDSISMSTPRKKFDERGSTSHPAR